MHVSKKVLVLSSSPRKDGNSELLCDQFVFGAREAGHDAEKVFLKDRKINYCTGCGTCSEGAKRCPQKDDMPEVLEKKDTRSLRWSCCSTLSSRSRSPSSRSIS